MAEVLAKLASKRPLFTWRDLVLVAAFLVGPIVWYAKIDAHSTNKSIHYDRDALEALVDKNMQEKYGDQFNTFSRDVRSDLALIKTQQLDVIQRLSRLEGAKEK